MASGRMALGDAKSARDVDPTLRPDSRLAFGRPGRQTPGAHWTPGIIFADDICMSENPFLSVACKWPTDMPTVEIISIWTDWPSGGFVYTSYAVHRQI